MRLFTKKILSDISEDSSFGVPNFSSSEEFSDFLDNTLIPDLQESGLDATADDFEEFLYWAAKM